MKIGKVVVQTEASRPWLDGKREGPQRREPHKPPSDGKRSEIEKCLAWFPPRLPGELCPQGARDSRYRRILRNESNEANGSGLWPRSTGSLMEPCAGGGKRPAWLSKQKGRR